MCPTYDYLCVDCSNIEVINIPYDDRDNAQTCSECNGHMRRTWIVAPGVRTEKTSRTYLDGYRPNDGLKEEQKAAALDAEAMNHNPKSTKYLELKAEAKARRVLSADKTRKSKFKINKGAKND